MKRYLYSMLVLALFSIGFAASDDDTTASVEPKSIELTFLPSGGEQHVDAPSEKDWYYEYDANWLLVRQQQDKIRVIVDENTSTENRTDIVKIMLADGSLYCNIKVVQVGTELQLGQTSFSIQSAGGIITIPVKSNSQWTIEYENDWFAATTVEDSLQIDVTRNFQMKERSGFITLNSGDISMEISIIQSACEWFDSFELIPVEAGSFMMGAQKESTESSNYDSSAYQIESPVHQVSVNSFMIGKYEVTQEQWEAAMGSNPSVNKGDRLPVESISWNEVQNFISILNENTGLNYRLPSEAEWEFAAKGGNSSSYYKYSGSSILGACGWYYSNSEASTHSVGSKIPNELSIYDMSGNVREWCNDWFDHYSSSIVDNPQGPVNGSVRINRGGSWSTPAANCRNTYRHNDYPNESSQDLGFRLALTITAD